jgi:superfamily I DNA/RNA helicase
MSLVRAFAGNRMMLCNTVVLAERNLEAVACREGRVVGTESQIRVFDIQHIKGLEFEAVFFVGVDTLAARHEDLFEKYLFVGITRAATYLGLTCDRTLPRVLEPLRPHLSDGTWS